MTAIGLLGLLAVEIVVSSCSTSSGLSRGDAIGCNHAHNDFLKILRVGPLDGQPLSNKQDLRIHRATSDLESIAADFDDADLRDDLVAASTDLDRFAKPLYQNPKDAGVNLDAFNADEKRFSEACLGHRS